MCSHHSTCARKHARLSVIKPATYVRSPSSLVESWNLSVDGAGTLPIAMSSSTQKRKKQTRKHWKRQLRVTDLKFRTVHSRAFCWSSEGCTSVAHKHSVAKIFHGNPSPRLSTQNKQLEKRENGPTAWSVGLGRAGKRVSSVELLRTLSTVASVKVSYDGATFRNTEETM